MRFDAPCAALPCGSAGRRHDEPKNLDWQFIAVPKHFKKSWPPHQESRASIFHQWWAFKRIEMLEQRKTLALMESVFLSSVVHSHSEKPFLAVTCPGLHQVMWQTVVAMIWPRPLPEQGYRVKLDSLKYGHVGLAQLALSSRSHWCVFIIRNIDKSVDLQAYDNLSYTYIYIYICMSIFWTQTDSVFDGLFFQ